jgi:tetratricopeptide (TPR) repeat protein
MTAGAFSVLHRRLGFLYAIGALAVLFIGQPTALGQSEHAPQDSSDVSNPQARTLFIRGLTKSYLGEHDQAASLFEHALEIAPQEPALLSALAEAELHRDNQTSAIYYARQARDHAPDEPYYHLQVARSLRDADRTTEAISAYQELLSRFPEHEEGRLALAHLYQTQDRPQKALEQYEVLVDSAHHVSVEAYAEMLELYRTVDNPDGLERTLKRLIDLRRDAQVYRRLLGQLYAEQSRYEDAIPLFEALLEENPNDPRLLSQLKMLYVETDQSRKAERVGSNVQTENDSPDQLVARARALFDAKGSSDSTAVEQSLALLHKALDRVPNHTRALDLLGSIQYEQGEYEAAAATLARALDEDPKDPVRWRNAASAHLKIDSLRRAAALAEEGLLLFPGRPDLAELEARARLRLGEYETARIRFQEVLSQPDTSSTSPDERASLHAGLGRAFYNLGREADADSSFHRALNFNAEHPEALIYFARSLARQERTLDRALQLAQRAVSVAPSRPGSHGALGSVHAVRGEYEEATAAFKSALDLGSAPAWVYERFGDFHQTRGNDALAQKYWQEALDRSPNRESLEQKLQTSPKSE